MAGVDWPPGGRETLGEPRGAGECAHSRSGSSGGVIAGVRPPLDPAIAAACAAEEAGFDALWWSDHFLHWFPPGVWTPELIPMARALRSPHAFLDPMPIMAAVARETERIRLGPAV